MNTKMSCRKYMAEFKAEVVTERFLVKPAREFRLFVVCKWEEGEKRFRTSVF